MKPYAAEEIRKSVARMVDEEIEAGKRGTTVTRYRINPELEKAYRAEKHARLRTQNFRR